MVAYGEGEMVEDRVDLIDLGLGSTCPWSFPLITLLVTNGAPFSFGRILLTLFLRTRPISCIHPHPLKSLSLLLLDYSLWIPLS